MKGSKGYITLLAVIAQLITMLSLLKLFCSRFAISLLTNEKLGSYSRQYISLLEKKKYFPYLINAFICNQSFMVS